MIRDMSDSSVVSVGASGAKRFWEKTKEVESNGHGKICKGFPSPLALDFFDDEPISMVHFHHTPSHTNWEARISLFFFCYKKERERSAIWSEKTFSSVGD